MAQWARTQPSLESAIARLAPRRRAGERLAGLRHRLAGVAWRRHAARLLAFAARHRSLAGHLLARACWWGGLFVLAKVGHSLLDGFTTGPWREQAVVATAVGVLLAAMGSLLAQRQTRIRVASLLLGSAHAFLLATLWANGHDPSATMPDRESPDPRPTYRDSDNA
ncbi:MAG: hypothetical protein B7733_24560 [Myxococcales bacterium FL481]|nr:MAG: hypothetical protein B7733_24560 [Myxococcales bacterium FL481]